MSKPFFAVVLRYLVSSEVVDAHRPAHVAFLDQGYASGLFIVSGRQTPATGGVILARASSRAALLEVLHQDPFYTEGCAEYQIFEFMPTKFSKAFESLI